MTKLGVFGAAVCFDVSYEARNDMIQCIERIVVALNLFCIFTVDVAGGVGRVQAVRQGCCLLHRWLFSSPVLNPAGSRKL